MKCDFCSHLAVAITFELDEFVIQIDEPTKLTLPPMGPWTACQDCKELIEAGRWQELENRGAEHMLAMYGPICSQEQARRAIGQMIGEFRRHWKGKQHEN